MSTILIKDSLRQSVEAASGGAQTVLYTAKGQPTYMNIVEKFDLSTIDPSLAGTHPAFILNGVEKDKIFIGTYQSVVRNGELLSLPNQLPAIGGNLAYYNTLARANGAGHHLITNAEWSAVALGCYKNGINPLGNTYYGRAAENSASAGRRGDGLAAGSAASDAEINAGTKNPRTYTGSGDVLWRHNQKYNGIADLAGNVTEFTTGLRLYNNEIQILANNDAALATFDPADTFANWKAIDAVTGELITPDGAGTTATSVKIASSGTADYTIVCSATNTAFGSITNPSPTKPVGAAAIKLLKALCIFPMIQSSATYGNDTLYVSYNSTVTRYTQRGGAYWGGSSAGLYTLILTGVASDSGIGKGTRTAYYIP